MDDVSVYQMQDPVEGMTRMRGSSKGRTKSHEGLRDG